MNMDMHRPQQIATFKTCTYDFIMIQLTQSCVTLPDVKEIPRLDKLLKFIDLALFTCWHSFFSETILQLNELLHWALLHWKTASYYGQLLTTISVHSHLLNWNHLNIRYKTETQRCFFFAIDVRMKNIEASWKCRTYWRKNSRKMSWCWRTTTEHGWKKGEPKWFVFDQEEVVNTCMHPC